jgi:hypothetical protein
VALGDSALYGVAVSSALVIDLAINDAQLYEVAANDS